MIKAIIDQLALVYLQWLIAQDLIHAAVNTTTALWDAGILVWP
jgi:hypothetical protein